MMQKLSSIFLLLLIFYVAFYPSLVNGAIDVNLTFTPTLGTNKFLLTFDEIKVHRARVSNESGWILIGFDKNPINIANSKNFTYLVAENSELPVGRYDQISISIIGASLETEGTLDELEVTKNEIYIQKEFMVMKDSPKDLTLIFEIDMQSTVLLKRLVYEAMILE